MLLNMFSSKLCIMAVVNWNPPFYKAGLPPQTVNTIHGATSIGKAVRGGWALCGPGKESWKIVSNSGWRGGMVDSGPRRITVESKAHADIRDLNSHS